MQKIPPSIAYDNDNEKNLQTDDDRKWRGA